MATFIERLIQKDAQNCFAALAHQPYVLFLDSADRNHPNGRYSFIACDPVEVITLQDCKNTDPFAYVQERITYWSSIFKPNYDPALPPFQGGAAGLFGYDLGRRIEDLPDIAAPSNTPALAIGIYDQVLAFDHKEQETWLITHSRDEKTAKARQNDILPLLEESSIEPQTETLDWQAQFKASAFKARVARVIEYIRAGDIFQANLSQCFEADLPDEFDPAAHYLHLRNKNPAPFAGYIDLEDVQISSASPERFLHIKDNQVETKPIKGTVPRLKNTVKDQENIQTLLNSDKDRAENIMIVDLLRNDLSKVCEPASIQVPALCKLESFTAVHHLVSTVTGKLKENKTPLDLLKACFPGGSITGAPKIRAMEIIEELEEKQRGPYCGSLGYIGFDGTMDSNILIRTLIYKNDTVSFNVGSGIVSDSNPKAEYQETLDKGSALFESFDEHKKEVKAQ